MRLKKWVSKASKYDIAALVLGVCLFLYFFVTAPRGIAMLDESAYWLLGNRLSFGDRLITDEWHLIQFSAIIDVPVYFIYTKIIGSTEGLILFARYAFVVCDALFYFYMYRKLRRFGAAGVAASVLFCAMVPELFFSFSYCTVSAFALMWLIMNLFLEEKPKRAAQLVLSGAVLAVMVLENPLLILAYFLWACFVAFSFAGERVFKKPFLSGAAFLLEKRVFFTVTLGSAAVFVLFAAFLLLNGAFDEIKTVLPYLFSGSEYNAGNLIDMDQLMQAAGFYNRYFIIGQLCSAAAAAAVCLFRMKNRRVKWILFLISAGFFAACCLHAGIRTVQTQDIYNRIRFCQCHNLPLLLFAPVPFLLSEKRDTRRICALRAGYLYSLLMDIPSQSFIGIGGFIVRVPLVLQLGECLHTEFFSKQRALPAGERAPQPRAKKNARTAVSAAAALCLSVCFLWDAAYIGAEGVYKIPERLFLFSDQPLGYTLSKGPLKGLKTTEELGAVYDATLRDMDVIREDPDCKVAMLDTVAFPYLYLNRPFATYTMSYAGEFDRLLAYWQLPFSAKPDWLYLPYYNSFLMFRYDNKLLNETLSQVRAHLECEVIRGEAGYLIRVDSIR